MALTADFEGRWHTLDLATGETREIVGAEDMDLDEVLGMLDELYATTLPGRDPAQQRMF